MILFYLKSNLLTILFNAKRIRKLNKTSIEFFYPRHSTELMEIYFSPYEIVPLKRLNRTSTMGPQQGVFLMATTNGQKSYADYFPHSAFGNKSCSQFLSEFKFQEDEYDRKVFHLLKMDLNYQKKPYKKFYNHQLWSGSEDFESSLVKYKLLVADDRTFLSPLHQGVKLRLDCGALFSTESFKKFLDSIPSELRPLIEYVEDPTPESDWRELGIKTARDLFNGNDYDFYIHRPSCEFYPQNEKNVIFSSYLGSDLGRWHTYCELMELGDLNLVHGIISNGFYNNQRHFLTGSYHEGFMADKQEVTQLYQDLTDREWKFLCHM